MLVGGSAAVRCGLASLPGMRKEVLGAPEQLNARLCLQAGNKAHYIKPRKRGTSTQWMWRGCGWPYLQLQGQLHNLIKDAIALLQGGCSHACRRL